MNKVTRRLLASLLVFTATLTRLPAAANWAENIHATASATASWVENVSRTSYAPTRKDAAVYELDLAATQFRQLAPAWLLEAGLTAHYTNVPDFSATDLFTVGPRLQLQYKFGLGPYVPVLQWEASAQYQSARYTELDGWTAASKLTLAKRFTSTFRASVYGEWREHNARSSAFDVQQQTIGLDTTWDFAERWRVNASVSRLFGDIAANAAPDVWAQAVSGAFGPKVFNYYTSIPAETTELYGPGWVTYNVYAHVDLWSAGLAYQIAPRTSLELRLSGANVVNLIGIEYPTRSCSLGLVHQF